MIIGLPTETLRGCIRSILQVRSDRLLSQADLSCNRLCILPNTELKRRAREFGLVYDPRPPYLIRRTATMSEADLDQAMRFVSHVVPLPMTYIMKSNNSSAWLSSALQKIGSRY